MLSHHNFIGQVDIRLWTEFFKALFLAALEPGFHGLPFRRVCFPLDLFYLPLCEPFAWFNRKPIESQSVHYYNKSLDILPGNMHLPGSGHSAFVCTALRFIHNFLHGDTFLLATPPWMRRPYRFWLWIRRSPTLWLLLQFEVWLPGVCVGCSSHWHGECTVDGIT